MFHAHLLPCFGAACLPDTGVGLAMLFSGWACLTQAWVKHTQPQRALPVTGLCLKTNLPQNKAEGVHEKWLVENNSFKATFLKPELKAIICLWVSLTQAWVKQTQQECMQICVWVLFFLQKPEWKSKTLLKIRFSFEFFQQKQNPDTYLHAFLLDLFDSCFGQAHTPNNFWISTWVLIIQFNTNHYKMLMKCNQTILKHMKTQWKHNKKHNNNTKTV